MFVCRRTVSETCLVIVSKSSFRSDTQLVWNHPCSSVRSTFSLLFHSNHSQQISTHHLQRVPHQTNSYARLTTQQTTRKLTFHWNTQPRYESLSARNTAESEIRCLHLHKLCSECSLCILKPCTDSLNSPAHIQTTKIAMNFCKYMQCSKSLWASHCRS